MKNLIFFALIITSQVWAQNNHDLKRQLLLEVEAAYAANIERLSVSPVDCLISSRQLDRIKTLHENVSNLEKQGGITHCKNLTDQDPQSESHKRWLEARQIEKGVAAASDKLDSRTMWGKATQVENPANFIRPKTAPTKRPPRPARTTSKKSAPTVENKKCEILILSGEGQGISNNVPTIEGCETLCDDAKENGANVRCYYGDANITNAPQ